MSVTLQARVNGGAPSVGTVMAVVGNTIQMTAASMGTWGSPVATWSIFDFPVGFAAPAGWTYDATSESYNYLANSNPPVFVVTPWGAYMVRVTAFENGVSITDTLKVSILSPGGLIDHGRGEGALDGGNNKRWVGPIQENLRVIETALVGGAAHTPNATASTNMSRDGNADTAVRYLTAQRIFSNAALRLENTTGTTTIVKDDDTIATFDFSVTASLTMGGTAGFISAAAGDLSLTCTTGDEVNLVVNSVDILSVSSSAVKCHVTSMTFDDAATVKPTIAAASTVGKALTIAAGDAGAGGGDIGGALNLSGGTGGSGTDNAGDVTIALGYSPAAGSSAAFVLSSDTGPMRTVIDYFDAYVAERIGSGAFLSGATGIRNFYSESAAFTLSAISGEMQLYCNGYFRCRNPGALLEGTDGIQYKELDFASRVSIVSATTTTVHSWTTTSNRGYHVRAVVVVTNDTDNQAAIFVIEAAFKNVAGTVTQIGTSVVTAFNDTGQAGVTATVDFSGTAIRVRVTTDAAEQYYVTDTLDVTEGYLT